jgi:pilus assembly protein CpaC
MSNTTARTRHWFRFTIANLLILILGIAIGFVPLKLWELREPPKPQILVQFQVVDVSRDSLPTLGIDPANVTNGAVVTRKLNDSLFAHLESLRQADKATVLAEPTLITGNGQPAAFNVGGSFPVPVPSKAGTTTIEYREYGTRVDLLPTLLRNGRIRLAISPRISEIDDTRTIEIDGTTVPSVRTRSVETEIEMEDGETVVLGGFGQQSQQAETNPETLIVARVERVKKR